MLCTFALSAIAAQSAFAFGQTAVTCAKSGGATDFAWGDSHCRTNVGAGFGEYGHSTFAGSTKITADNILTGLERQVTKLKSVQAGVTLELQSQVLEGSGTMENKEEAIEMLAHGTGTITYKEVTVTAPAGKGCIAKGTAVGTIKTNTLTASNRGPLFNQLKFTPKEGETFAEFTVEGCSIAALNHVYTAKGSVTGNTEGTTTKFTHAGTTEQNTLFLSGQKAGFDGSLTIHGANGNGLALT
jgi:hypothetical protein